MRKALPSSMEREGEGGRSTDGMTPELVARKQGSLGRCATTGSMQKRTSGEVRELLVDTAHHQRS